MFTIKEVPYTVESNAFVLEFNGEPVDPMNGIFDSRQDAEFALEIIEADWHQLTS